MKFLTFEDTSPDYHIHGLEGRAPVNGKYLEFLTDKIISQQNETDVNYILYVDELLANYGDLSSHKVSHLLFFQACNKFCSILNYFTENYGQVQQLYLSPNLLCDKVMEAPLELKTSLEAPLPLQKRVISKKDLLKSFKEMESVLKFIYLLIQNPEIRAQVHKDINLNPKNSNDSYYLRKFYERLFELVEFDPKVIGFQSLGVIHEMRSLIDYLDINSMYLPCRYLTLNLSKLLFANSKEINVRNDPLEELRYVYYTRLLRLYQSPAGSSVDKMLVHSVFSSTVGRVMISNLHQMTNKAVTHSVSILFFEVLKQAFQAGSLAEEQIFYLEHSICQIKHFQACLGYFPSKQKHVSIKILYYLTKNNKQAAELFMKMMPVPFAKQLQIQNLRTVMEWTLLQWVDVIEKLNTLYNNQQSNQKEQEEEFRYLVVQKLKAYIEEYRVEWKRVPLQSIKNVISVIGDKNHNYSLQVDTELIQINHNHADFDPKFSEMLGKRRIGDFYIEDFQVENKDNQYISLTSIQAQNLLKASTFGLVNTDSLTEKIEFISIIVNLYKTQNLKKFPLVPYLLNIMRDGNQNHLHIMVLQLLTQLMVGKDSLVNKQHLKLFLEGKLLLILIIRKWAKGYDQIYRWEIVLEG